MAFILNFEHIYQYIVQYRHVPQLHRLIRQFIIVFLSCQPLNSTQKISPPEQATLFMTLMEYLISQAGALQVLVYKSSLQIFTRKILNYEGFNWVIQFLYVLSTLVLLF